MLRRNLLSKFGETIRLDSHVKKPSVGALFFGLIPFIAICFSVSLWDRIYPTVFGLPFNFFWLISWLFLTPACMWAAYRVDTQSAKSSTNQQGHP